MKQVPYRYRGPTGWVDLQANGKADALRAAARLTLDGRPNIRNLEVWNGKDYVKA